MRRFPLPGGACAVRLQRACWTSTAKSRLRLAGYLLVLVGCLLTGEALAQAEAEAERPIDSVRVLTDMVRWSGVVSSAFVIAIATLILRMTNRGVEGLGKAFVDSRLTLQNVQAFFRFFVFFATAAIVILLSFEISEEVLAVLGGTAAVAVGFAMKDLVASLVAGVMIMFDRPFQVGDRVTFGGQYGDILSVGLRSVKLRTLDDSVVTIPNSLFLNEVTSCGNYGVLNMQIMIDFLIGIDQDVNRARALVREAAVTSNFVYLANPVEVLVAQVFEHGQAALRLRLKIYVADTMFEKALETDITLRVMEALRVEGIRPPEILHRAIPADGEVAAGLLAAG
jgi:small-conductance mechanosensitive channel